MIEPFKKIYYNKLILNSNLTIKKGVNIMNKTAIAMKKEIRSVSNYRALLISKYYLNTVLLIITLYLGMINYAVSSFYVLLMLNLLPPILSAGFKDFNTKYDISLMKRIVLDSPFLLNSMKKKYRYTHLRYITNSISYIIAFLLLAIWQYSYNRTDNLLPRLAFVPLFVALSTLILRITGSIFYRLKLRYDILHNKV